MSQQGHQSMYIPDGGTSLSTGTSAEGSFGGVMGGNMGESFVASPHGPPQQQQLPFQGTSNQTGSITQFASPMTPQQQYSPSPGMYGHQQPQQQSYMSTPTMQYQQNHATTVSPQYHVPAPAPQNIYQPQQQSYIQPSMQSQSQFQQQQQTMPNLSITTQPPMPAAPPPAVPPPTPPSQYNQHRQVSSTSMGSTAPAVGSGSMGGGGYAARSAAAYAASSNVPSSVPSSGASVASSFNGRAPMASPQQNVSAASPSKPGNKYAESPAAQAQQNRVLTDCTRKIQEHAYYMKQAMDRDDLPTVLDRAAQMVGELGDGMSSSLTPKNYYELHMRALDDMPNLEEYLVALSTGEQAKYKMKYLYDCVQYCPKVLPRLYLQICAGSALVRSEEESAKWVLQDLIECVKCVQNPVRGLFLRHYLLQVARDKLPDKADVKDGYEFVLANFIEMNKLWVRLQHLPGEGKTKEQRKRRERERNELRILVGTNLVRLSQLEGVDGKIYGEIILPRVLEQITVCGDPLAQAYLMDCIIQVFPDENHIETLPVLLAVCPKLRDKVNIRTILQSLMDRLANYYADEELLDEADKNQVKQAMAMDSYPMFEECVQKVFNARGPKLNAKEVIRLQTALVKFSLKCYPGQLDQVDRAFRVCAEFVRQATSGVAYNQAPTPLDEVCLTELEKMLSIPLESQAMKVLDFAHYNDLFKCLSWSKRRDVGVAMLTSVVSSDGGPADAKSLNDLLEIVSAVIRDDQSTSVLDGQMASMGIGGNASLQEIRQEDVLLAKLVHRLETSDLEAWYDMLFVARKHLSNGGPRRVVHTLPAVVCAGIRLVFATHLAEEKSASATEEVKEPEATEERVNPETEMEGVKDDGPELEKEDSVQNKGKDEPVEPQAEPEQTTEDEQPEQMEPEFQIEKTPPDYRKILVFLQTTITMLSKTNPQSEIALLLEVAMAADRIAIRNGLDVIDNGFAQVMYELFTQAFIMFEECISDAKDQQSSILKMIGTIQQCDSLNNKDYETLITKIAQYSARMVKKQDQCKMVAICSHLFYPGASKRYQNAQRSLECLQRCLKIADASTSASALNVGLFVDLLEDYLQFFEQLNPSVSHAYITGLVALIREHLDSASVIQNSDVNPVGEAKAHFAEILQYIRKKKSDDDTKELFAPIKLDS